MIRPHFALTDHCVNGVLHALGGIVVLLQQPLDHPPHARPGGFIPLPINGAVFAEHLRQLPGHGHQLVVFVKIPDGLWGQVLVQAHQAVQKYRVQQRRGAVRFSGLSSSAFIFLVSPHCNTYRHIRPPPLIS